MIPTIEELQRAGTDRDKLIAEVFAPSRSRVTGTDEDILLAALHIYVTDHSVSCVNCGDDEDMPTVAAGLYSLAQLVQERRKHEN